MVDLATSVTLLALVLIVAAAYAVRVAVRGAHRSARAESAGSSVLLGRGPMEMTYWVLGPIGRGLIKVGVTANMVTLASLALGFATGCALAFGHFGLAALFSALSSLGDTLDGVIARESNTASLAGETFDAAVDRYNEFFFLGGIAVFFRGNVPILLMVLGALLGSFMVSYATAKAEALHVEPPRGSMRRAERATYLTIGAGLVPIASIVCARLDFTMELAPLAPLVAALTLVATVGNVSAARRLMKVAALVAGKKGDAHGAQKSHANDEDADEDAP